MHVCVGAHADQKMSDDLELLHVVLSYTAWVLGTALTMD